MAAGNIVGQVQVLVLPDGSMFTPQLNAILNQAVNQAGVAGAAIGKNVMQGVAPAAQQIGQTIDQNVTQRFFQAAASATAFTGAVMGTRAVIERTVGKLAGLYDQLAQAQAGFTAIIGEKAGGKLLEDIREFARVSPFVTQQLVNYSQQLLGVGMSAEKIVPLLRDTGNVISSVGGDTQNLSRVLFTLTQIKTVGRLVGQDAMQLQSSLIPITKMLSEFLGKSTTEIKKMQEQGRISADMVFSAIQMAGSKVPNAMDNAVKNIAGARAVLSDTITIMMQDAPALRAIYDDLVLGIQKFAAKLGDPKVQGVIQDALSSIGRAYEALKPALLSMMETMGEGSLTGIKSFAIILETLAKVIDSIPQPALEALAKALAAIAVLKAPMMLMNYVKQFQTMASIFKLGGGSAGFAQRIMGTGQAVEATAVAAQAGATSTQNFTTSIKANIGSLKQWVAGLGQVQTQALKTTVAAEEAALAASMSGGGGAVGGSPTLWAKGKDAAGRAGKWATSGKGKMVLAAGAMAAGTALSSQEGPAGEVLGTMAQYTAMGAMAGPWGAAAGAVVGAAVGLFNAQEKAAEEHKQRMIEIAKGTVGAWADAWDAAYGAGPTGARATAMQQRLAELKANVLNTTNAITEAANKANELKRRRTNGDTSVTQEQIDAADAQYAFLMDNFENVKLMSEEQSAEIKSQYSDLYDGIAKATEQSFAKLPADVQKSLQGSLFKAAPRQGQFTAQVADMEQLERVYRKYGLTLEEVGTLGDQEIARIVIAFESLSDAQKRAVEGATRYTETAKKAKETASGIYGVQSEAIGIRLASLNAEKSALEASTKAYENQGDETARLQAQQAALNAQMAVYAETMARVKNELMASGLDEPTAELRAQAAASQAAEDALKHYQIVAKGSMAEMSKKYGIASQELQRILGLEGQIKSDLKIYVTAEVEDAIKKILVVDKLLESLRTGKPITATGPQGGVGAVRAAAEREKARLEEVIKQYTGIGGGSKGGGGGGGQSFADKVKSAAAALENAIKSAMQSVEAAADAWKSTIKQRVQYEQAVSAGRALSNVQKQMQDIAYLRSGIAQLKTMGLSETAIAALDINALTDVRQVKKLLGSSPAQLAELSKAISERDKLAGQLSSDRQQEQSRKTIVLAIVEAAGILGYKVSEAQAKQIAATFNINATTDVTQMINDLLRQLSGGKVSL